MTRSWREPQASWTTAVVLAACGGYDLPRVPTGDHPAGQETLQVVEYPPPPAKVEVTGTAPRPGCYWQDGYWEWIGRRWEWLPGDWVEPPPGCYYAPRIIAVWVEGSQGSELYYARPRWYPLAPEPTGSEPDSAARAKDTEASPACARPKSCQTATAP